MKKSYYGYAGFRNDIKIPKKGISITEKDKYFESKKIKINALDKYKTTNLDDNGFTFVKLPINIRKDIKKLSNDIEEQFKNQTEIKEGDFSKYFYNNRIVSNINKMVHMYLVDFLSKKDKNGNKNIDEPFTDIYHASTNFRNTSLGTTKGRMIDNVSLGISSKEFHQDEAISTSLTNIFNTRRRWLTAIRNHPKEFFTQIPTKFLNIKNIKEFPSFWDKRYVRMINVWILFSKSSLDAPLVLCDKNTVDYNIDNEQIPYTDNSQGAYLHPNKNHKFYFMPKMKQGDAIIFESALTPHTSVKLENIKKQLPRQNFEMRFLMVNNNFPIDNFKYNLKLINIKDKPIKKKTSKKKTKKGTKKK
jgi:hypothetical protein